MAQVAYSNQSSGNQHYCSAVLRSNDVLFAFTAPYSCRTDKAESRPPLPWYDNEVAFEFSKRHGLAVRALGAWLGGGLPRGWLAACSATYAPSRPFLSLSFPRPHLGFAPQLALSLSWLSLSVPPLQASWCRTLRRRTP